MSTINSPSSNLLFPIKLDKESSNYHYVNDLLKKTKSLVLSNTNYNKFMKKYLTLTQESSFKCPEITSYPILKNEFIIPINRQTFSAGEKNYSKNKNDINEAKLHISNLIQQDNNHNEEKLLNNNKNNCPINLANNECGNNLNVKTEGNNQLYKKISSSNIVRLRDKKSILENESRIKQMMKYHSPLIVDKGLSSNCDGKINSKHGIEKDQFYNKNYYLNDDHKTLILDLLTDFEFNLRVFNYEENIFNIYNEKSKLFTKQKKTEVIAIINSMLWKLVSLDNQNVTSHLEKKYYLVDKQAINVKISSAILEISEMEYENNFNNFNNKGNQIKNPNSTTNYNNRIPMSKPINIKNFDFEKKKIQKINIPFALMPLIYYTSFDVFYTLIAHIFSFKDAHADADENKKEKTLNNNKILFMDYDKIKEISGRYMEYIKKNEDYQKDFRHPQTFKWMHEGRLYEIKFKPPKMFFSLCDKSFSITKSIPKELFIFLLKRNFINWDFFIFNYLSRYRKFRDTLNEKFFKKIRNFSGYKQTYTSISSYKLLGNNRFLDKLESFNCENFKVNLNEVKRANELRKSSCIKFFSTNSKNVTKFYTINSYKLIVIFKHSLKNKNRKSLVGDNFTTELQEYEFDFNFERFLKLENLKKFYNLEDYLRRMITINKNKPNTSDSILNKEIGKNEFFNLDLEYFEFLDDNFFKFLINSEKKINDNIRSTLQEQEEPKLQEEKNDLIEIILRSFTILFVDLFFR